LILGLAKGAGIKQGPVRLALNIKQSAPMDYDKALCKDYKETGFCGWGDSCKFNIFNSFILLFILYKFILSLF